MSQQAKRYNIYPSRIDHYHPHLSEYQLIRTRAESLTQSGWGRTVL